MPKGKVAVAVVHGIGDQDTEVITTDDGLEVTIGFEDKLRARIHEKCRDVCGPNVEDEIIVEGVHWAQVLNDKQEELQQSIYVDNIPKTTQQLRDAFVRFAGDAVAYGDPGTWVYNGVHTEFAATLKRLAHKTAPNAPLCIVAHSLGTVVTSNFLYDLQVDDPLGSSRSIPEMARKIMTDNPTPLERGHTLSLLYTLGSPLALWSILHEDFGVPIQFPPPRWMHSTTGVVNEWVNYYDKDDIVGYPLRKLYEDQNAKREAQNKEPRMLPNLRDEQINVGNWLNSRTPLSHMMYWEDEDVVQPISDRLMETWQAVVDGRIVLEEA